MDRYERLKAILSEMGRTVIAFSGGVDSTLLLKAAVDAPGCDPIPITAISETFIEPELDRARCIASDLGLDLRIVHSREMDDPGFRDNSPDRCYLCKRIRFEEMVRIANAENARWVADGSILDDESDHRPGSRAAQELGIRHPLAEAGLDKAAIREISRELDLPTWDLPSSACLASRIPYGEEITKEKLFQIEQAEGLLRSLGLRQVRVRHHGKIARIEVDPDHMGTIMIERGRIVKAFRDLGFIYVTLDISGFRSGSLNEVLSRDISPSNL